jgi:hypothetical protein
MTPAGFKTSITQYMPDTGAIVTTESTTTESIGLLNGKKAENLSLSGAYCLYRKRPIVLDTEATPV